MTYYDYNVAKMAIADLIDGKHLDHPNDTYEDRARTLRDKQIDRLVQMISAMTQTCYAAGAREVQQNIIRALDLRHLLGVDAR